ncbi:hypothetical protein [Hungatella effluvii]|uniref:hypothetical protein n=1 Tax=Hungatella effluvii TaxID=1096246 RepID=UPI0022E6F613|nr:hypothetical protein [Hungatella effluvii]
MNNRPKEIPPQGNLHKARGLSQAQRRMEEPDRLFQRLYEDNIAEKFSDERFAKLSGGYEAEQKDLQGKVANLQASLFRSSALKPKPLFTGYS